jgi:hypothetical protein
MDSDGTVGVYLGRGGVSLSDLTETRRRNGDTEKAFLGGLRGNGESSVPAAFFVPFVLSEKVYLRASVFSPCLREI